MRKQHFELDGRAVTLYTDDVPQILFIQPVDAHDAELLDAEIEAMRDCALPFALAAFAVKDWDRDLSPWAAPPVFGKVPFGGMAEETLAFVLDRLLPGLRTRLGADTKLCLGGYSLAGLFALWAATRTDAFSGVAAASPSVWFPGWLDYVKANPIRAQSVYLSLGDREERAKNPVMATVGDCIREQYALLQSDHDVTLEWNPGNHFQDSEKRTARAFCRIAEQRSESCSG
jgi:predicted alpha/beta superfamily hydrolase